MVRSSTFKEESTVNCTLIFLWSVKGAHGCPVRVYTDRGTENGILAAMQCYLV